MLAVVLFGSSTSLGRAYGIAVTIDVLITTTMTFFVVHYSCASRGWLRARPASSSWIDSSSSRRLVKVFDGGWFRS